MTARPQVVSLDLDDTLWACDAVIEAAEHAVYEWLAARCPRITREFDLEAMRRVRHETASDRPELEADLTALRRRTLAWHARRAGYDPALADTAVEVFLEARHRVEFYPDVVPTLRRLAPRYSLVAVTNGNADVARVGLGQWFDIAVSAADVGAPKPDPAMFEHVCRRLGIDPAGLVHVGDDPVRDVDAARRAGARAVWVNRAGRSWPVGIRPAPLEARTLEPLPALLAGL